VGWFATSSWLLALAILNTNARSSELALLDADGAGVVAEVADCEFMSLLVCYSAARATCVGGT
jgi:hypothetical protein